VRNAFKVASPPPPHISVPTAVPYQ
jgi:hypothetical protein